MTRPGKRERLRARQQRRLERREAKRQTTPAANPTPTTGASTVPVRGALAPVIEMDRFWYLARTAPRLGPLGRKMLDDALAKGETRAHRPRASEVVVRRGRRVVRYTPLVVRTLIVGVRDDDHLAEVQALPGIAEIVAHPQPDTSTPGNIAGFVNKPARLDPEGLQAFLIALAAGEIVKPVGVEVGSNVMVITGPFASFPAIVEAILPGDRIKVAVSIFGRPSPVDLGIADVTLV